MRPRPRAVAARGAAGPAASPCRSRSGPGSGTSQLSASSRSGSRVSLLPSTENGLLAPDTSVSILAAAGPGGSTPLPPVARILNDVAPPSTQAPPPCHTAEVHNKSHKLLLETNKLQQSDTQCTLPNRQGGEYRRAPRGGPSPGRMTVGACLLGLRLLGLECEGSEYKIQK